MINILIVIVLVFIAVILIKMNHFKHRITIILVLLFALFLYSSFSVINKTNDLDLKSVDGLAGAFKIYLGWLGNGFSNLKTLTGNAMKMDWISTNESFQTKEIDSNKR
jgi:Ca2+/Na+ antiporter